MSACSPIQCPRSWCSMVWLWAHICWSFRNGNPSLWCLDPCSFWASLLLLVTWGHNQPQVTGAGQRDQLNKENSVNKVLPLIFPSPGLWKLNSQLECFWNQESLNLMRAACVHRFLGENFKSLCFMWASLIWPLTLCQPKTLSPFLPAPVKTAALRHRGEWMATGEMFTGKLRLWILVPKSSGLWGSSFLERR